MIPSSSDPVVAGVNDVKTTHPHHARMLISPRPTTVHRNSQREASAQCRLGHFFVATVREITRETVATACPDCRAEIHKASARHMRDNLQRVVAERAELRRKSLANNHPDLAAEAQFDADAYRFTDAARMPWKCAEGHEWEAPIRARSNGRGNCPVCQPSSRGFDTSAAVAHVYVLHDQDNHVVKVGVTGVDSRRLSGFGNVGLETIAAFDVPGADAHAIEVAGLAAIREVGQPVPEAHFKRLYGSSIGGYTECVWDDSGASVTAAIDAISAAMGCNLGPSS